jgi:hypothetical protein
MQDDVDALVFGAHIVIRNNPKTLHAPTASQASKSVDLDDEDDAPLFLKDGETAFYYLASIIDVCGLDKAGMILVALLAGGDYNTIGIRSIGIKAAVRLAKLGYGKTLLEATSGCKTHTTASLARCAAWRELAAQELETTGIEGQDGARLAAAVNLRGAVDFPGMKILRNYTDPVIKKDYPPIDWNREINLVGLVNYYQQTFEWNHQRVINSLRNNLFEAIAVREIRRHALIVDSRKDLAGLTQASKTKPPSYTASPIYSTKELLWVAVHDEKKSFATDQVRSYRVELNPKIFLDVILPALPAVDPFPFESGDEAAPPSSTSNSGSPAKGSPFKRSQSTVLSPFKGTPTKKKRPVEPTGRTEVSHWIPVSVFEMADGGPELIAAYREKEAAKTKKKEAVLERKRSKDAGEMVPRAKAKPKAKAATKGKGKAKLMESEDDSDASGYASSRTLTSSVPLDLSPFTIKKRTRATPIAAYDSDDELPAPFNPNTVANFLTKPPTPSPSHSSVPQRSASRAASPYGSPTKIRKIPPQVIDLTDSDDEDQDLTPMPKGRMIDLLMANKNKAGGSRTPGGKDWKQVEVVVIDSD